MFRKWKVIENQTDTEVKNEDAGVDYETNGTYMKFYHISTSFASR